MFDVNNKLKLLISICMFLHIVMLPHVKAQAFLLKWPVSVYLKRNDFYFFFLFHLNAGPVDLHTFRV